MRQEKRLLFVDALNDDLTFNEGRLETACKERGYDYIMKLYKKPCLVWNPLRFVSYGISVWHQQLRASDKNELLHLLAGCSIISTLSAHRRPLIQEEIHACPSLFLPIQTLFPVVIGYAIGLSAYTT